MSKSEHTATGNHDLRTHSGSENTHATTQAHSSHHKVGFWHTLVESNLLNVLILVAVIIYLANRYIPKALDARKDQISKELKKAKEAKKQAEENLKTAKEKTEKLALEIEDIKTEAKKTANAIKVSIEGDTEKEIETLKQRIRKEISTAESEALQNIQKSASQAALKLAEETLVKVSQNEDVQKKLINDFISDLKEPSKN